ncbi:MAG: pyridoxamine kinase [Clostridiales bacterium]|nr:MAG: pyridoxamine kinase [Clostridiales bacterium]
MAYQRILTIQDISCVGQCSLTVALPILSACGLETAILPSAVLSTHTAGFSGYTFRDLTDDIPNIAAHWKKEGILFNAFYTGYLGSTQQIEYVKQIMNTLGEKNSIKIVDPAMADNGTLYPAFDQAFVEKMKTLCYAADIILPNITEACLITDTVYPETYEENFIQGLLEKLAACGAKTVVLTGVGYRPDKTGVIVLENHEISYYEHQRISKGCHGTGDVYASAFTGALLRGFTTFEAAKIAADYTVTCIEKTVDDPSHWYGVKFEKGLPQLMALLEEKADCAF